MDSCPLQYTAPTLIQATATARMVKSVTLHGHGQFRRIKVEETPLEYNLKSDHVELNVHYCGLNFTDNYLRLGIIRNSNFPVIMGSECSGIITRVGEDVKDLQVGQKVLCLRMQGGLFRKAVHVPRKHCFELPKDTDLNEAVALGLNYLVAHVCLKTFARLRPRQTIFIHSIAGGVGTAVTELSHAVPVVKVYGTASQSKHERLSTCRVERVFDHREAYVKKLLKIHPEGVDVVINNNGGCDSEKCFKLLNQRGILIHIGSNSTAIYPKTKVQGMRPKWDTNYDIPMEELINKNLTVAGLDIGRFIETFPKLTQEILTEIFHAYSNGAIEPHVHSVLPFENVVDGMTQLCRRDNFGKIILAAVEEVQAGEPNQEVPDYEEEAQQGNSTDEPQPK